MNMFKWMFTACVAVFLLYAVVPAHADKHKVRVFGTVESVDVPNNAFVVLEQNGTKIRFSVDARSEFEVEPADRKKRDFDVPFSELKTGDKVKVKAYPATPPALPLVDDVEIYR